MASKKRGTMRAAKALLAPSSEEEALRKLVAKNTECIIRIEETLGLLVRNLCRDAKMNMALAQLRNSSDAKGPSK